MQSEVASCVLLGSSQPQADAPPTNALPHAHATRWGASLPATETTLVASTRTSASARPQGRARIFGILGANSAAHLCGSGHERQLQRPGRHEHAWPTSAAPAGKHDAMHGWHTAAVDRGRRAPGWGGGGPDDMDDAGQVRDGSRLFALRALGRHPGPAAEHGIPSLSLSLSRVCVCVCVCVCVYVCVCVCVCVCVHSSVCLFLLGADCSACIVVSCSPSASDCAHACLSAQVVWGAEPSGKYDDTYYLPQSTCTEGRNYLLQLAYEKGVARGEQYIYFIYTEDDAELDEIIDFGLSQGVRTDEWRLNARFCCHMFASFACAPLPPLVCQRVCPCLSSPQRSRPFPGPIPHIRGLSSQIPTSRGLPLQWLRLPRAS